MLVVFGYPDGRLPNPTFRAYKRARRAARAKGLAARVELRPLGDLPSVVDVLVASTPVAAPDGVTVRSTLVAPPDRAAAELERLLDELVARGSLGHEPAPPRTIAIHRGVEPLTERARVADA